jgi:hypothetical protein
MVTIVAVSILPGFGITQNATFALMMDRAPASGYGTASALWNLAYDAGHTAVPSSTGPWVPQSPMTVRPTVMSQPGGYPALTAMARPSAVSSCGQPSTAVRPDRSPARMAHAVSVVRGSRRSRAVCSGCSSILPTIPAEPGTGKRRCGLDIPAGDTSSETLCEHWHGIGPLSVAGDSRGDALVTGIIQPLT